MRVLADLAVDPRMESRILAGISAFRTRDDNQFLERAIGAVARYEYAVCRWTLVRLLGLSDLRAEAVGVLRTLADLGDAAAAAELDGWLRIPVLMASVPVEDDVGEIVTTVSPDGGLLATAGRRARTVRIWHLPSGDPLRDLAASGPVDAVAFSTDGNFVAVAARWPHAVEVFRLDGDAPIRTIPRSSAGLPRVLSFSPDGSLLATGRGLWRVATGEMIGRRRHADGVAFSPDGRLMVTGSRYSAPKGVRIRDGRTGNILTDLPGPADALAISPDGRTLATALTRSAKGSLNLWDPRPGPRRRGWTAGPIVQLTFTSDGGLLVTASGHASVQYWDPANGRSVREVALPDWGPVAFGAEGRTVVTSRHPNRVVRCWRVDVG